MFSFLFDPGLTPHGFCLLWDPTLLWLHAGSDVATGVAYFAIPIGLASLVIKRPDLLFGWIFWLFALFILACGTTHFMDVWVLWHPDYGLQGLIKGFTAVASILTATLFWAVLPRLQMMPTPAQFRVVSERLTDETMRHERTVEQLRRTEASFQLLVESVHDCAMFMLDTSGHVSSWNAGAQTIMQYDGEEVRGRHFTAFYQPDEQAVAGVGAEADSAASQGSYQQEKQCVRRDGTAFPAEILINAVHGAGGSLVGYAAVIRDITQRKQAEIDLEQARAALAQSQKMEAIGQLTGGIAHDFNNILTAILGSAQLLAIGREELGPKTKRGVEIIRRAGEHGADLTRRLLAFSRRQALAPARTDVNRLVAGISELLRRTLGESVTVETVMAGGLRDAMVDPNQLESALLNLAVNARDAMPDGGRLTIATSNAFLDDDYVRQHADVASGHYVVISLTDTGTGMTNEVRARALEPFYTTKEIGRGTGLGLSQVYGFVRQSDGHLALFSEVGHGTTVKLYLLRCEGEQRPVPTETVDAAGPLPSGTETILVVDDDVDVRGYSANAARHLGYNVLEAGDASDAIAILETHPEIHLLFTDVGLPGMNGKELADKARVLRPDLRTVFTSGYAQSAIANLGLLERGILFLPKPFRLDGLAKMLRTALD